MNHDPQRDIVQWAENRRFPWYYTYEDARCEPELKVHCGCVTAYFRQGDLVRIQAEAGSELFDALFEELTRLFARRAASRAAFDAEMPKAVLKRLNHG